MEYSFGAWVKHRRKALDLTQQELAQKVGCSLSAIYKIEADERRPSRQVAELLARNLEIPDDQRPLFLKVARQEKVADALGEITATEPSSPQPTFKVPLPSGSLIGREFELAEIARLIQDPPCRLLTLTGQGGIGKTHLAIHAANSIDQPQPVFVSLAPVTGREQAVTAIADALGIVLYTASDRADQLISYLRDKELLLILDNFEHLSADAGCLDLVSDILRGSPRVKILSTSRQPLQLQTEWVFEVQGLPLPKSDQPEELGTSSAVILFIQRANQIMIGFKPTHADLSDIARICELVEGLPLGIELAAAWARALSCREIANEIQNSLDFLAASVRDLPERHRSMRATIEYSWKLLADEEQRVLRRLSVFRGGFDRRAAEVVANASLQDLLALVSKSLIRRAESGRYDMHGLIHQYALSRLQQDAAEYEQTSIGHSQYYAELLDRRGSALKGSERMTVVAEFVSDLANLRQAWLWSSNHAQATELSRSADTLFWLYESRSNCREGVPLYRKAIEGLQIARDADAPEKWTRQLALGQALSYEGYFLFRQGQHPQGREALKSSLALLKEIPHGDSQEVRMAVSNAAAFLGTVTSVMGDFAEGDRLLQTGLKMKQELDDPWGSAFCLRQIGLAADYRGEYARSYTALEHSLNISRALGNAWAIAASLNQLGFMAHARGDIERAREYFTEGLELSRDLEDRASVAVALDGLGLVEAGLGRGDEAQSLFEESIALWKEIGEQGSLAQTLIHYGNVLLKMGKPSEARKYFLESLSVARAAQITPVLLDALIGEAEIQMADGAFESAFEILIAARQNPAAPFVTRARAERLRSELEQQFTAQQMEAIHSSAVNKPIESILNEISGSADK